MIHSQNELFNIIRQTSDLQDIQNYTKDIFKLRGFVDQTIQDKMLLLIEEVGELAKAIRKSNTCMAIDYEKIKNYDTVESEIADVFIVLMSICNILNINIYDAFITKESENIKRNWKK